MQKLLEPESSAALCSRFGRPAVIGALRGALTSLRDSILDGTLDAAPDCDSVVAMAEAILIEGDLGMRRVINATGIILHTNVGRAPMAPQARAAVAEAMGYCNVELDLRSGNRGVRGPAVESLLRELTGSEAGFAVNNGAAAILLVLSALASGGEVIVSRGELVEIGGGFRVPDVIRQGGARLVEVGSTNKTRLADYAGAVGPETRVLLKVHQSNFQTIGFVEEAPLKELAVLAAAKGIVVVADLGSGLLQRQGAMSEPTPGEALVAGADVVTCSGDKLLGGPQAGLILGRQGPVDAARRHPLMRALRLDKMSLAALEATLQLHRDAPDQVPVVRMLRQGVARIEARALLLRDMVGAGSIEPSEGFAGGGALPKERIASRMLTLDPPAGCGEASRRLRRNRPAVLCRQQDGRILIDVLAVADSELADLATALRAAMT